jgi:hypothetical protein
MFSSAKGCGARFGGGVEVRWQRRRWGLGDVHSAAVNVVVVHTEVSVTNEDGVLHRVDGGKVGQIRRARDVPAASESDASTLCGFMCGQGVRGGKGERSKM